jgi:hypothetical protein
MVCLLLLLMSVATLADAQEVWPGEQVRFIERDQHIPAHPTPVIVACMCAL